MKKAIRKLILIPVLAVALVATVLVGGMAVPEAQAAGKTGVGLAEHALMAYNQGWKYQYGAARKGYVDCSGLIYMYAGGPRTGMLGAAKEKGRISTLPRIHGLVLYEPGHVGVYVGNGMEVDARSSGQNMKYQSVASKGWTYWLKHPSVQYPTNGWVTFNGNQYYYENGQYVVSCTKTIDGKTYTFKSNGLVSGSAPASGGGASSGSSSTSGSSSKKNTDSTSKAASTAPTYTNLKVDSKGDAVKKLQTRLKELDYYYEAVNNYYDYFTADAVSAYQRANGISITGNADAATQKSLFASSAKKNANKGTVSPSLHSSLVAQMQKRLIELGYMTGEPTTYYGDATKAAVIAYQAASGLDQDGVMNAAALEVLYSEAAVAAPVEVSSAAPSSAEDEAASEGLETASLASEAGRMIVNDDIVPTVAAAVQNGLEDEPASAFNGNWFALVIVLLCAGLTAVFFVARKYGKNIRCFAVALAKEAAAKLPVPSKKK